MIPVTDIEVMDRPGLVALWSDLFGGPPPKGLSRPALRRLLAFEVQAQAFGGLPKGFAARLERAAADNAPTLRADMQPGGRLLREWNGVTHAVDVTEQGYRWRDQTWRSLSVTAERIRDKIAASKKRGLWMGGVANRRKMSAGPTRLR